MKKNKLLFASFVVSCFLFVTNVKAQATVVDFTVDVIDRFIVCAGESVDGTVYVHAIDNGQFIVAHWTAEYIGRTTGNTYKAMGFNKFPPGENVFPSDSSVQVIGEGGLITLIKQIDANDKFRFDCH